VHSDLFIELELNYGISSLSIKEKLIQRDDISVFDMDEMWLCPWVLLAPQSKVIYAGAADALLKKHFFDQMDGMKTCRYYSQHLGCRQKWKASFPILANRISTTKVMLPTQMIQLVYQLFMIDWLVF